MPLGSPDGPAGVSPVSARVPYAPGVAARRCAPSPGTPDEHTVNGRAIDLPPSVRSPMPSSASTSSRSGGRRACRRRLPGSRGGRCFGCGCGCRRGCGRPGRLTCWPIGGNGGEAVGDGGTDEITRSRHKRANGAGMVNRPIDHGRHVLTHDDAIAVQHRDRGVGVRLNRANEFRIHDHGFAVQP